MKTGMYTVHICDPGWLWTVHALFVIYNFYRLKHHMSEHPRFIVHKRLKINLFSLVGFFEILSHRLCECFMRI